MKKNLLSTFALLTLCVTVMAAPARRGVYKILKLSDGTEVRATLVGDEYGHFWKGDDGKAYIQDGDAFLAVDANEIIQEARALREEMNAAFAKRQKRHVRFGGYNPYYGKKRGIIILVNFTDMQFQPKHDHEFFERFANEEGFNYRYFKGSVADYFKAQSLNQFELNFDVYGPVTVSQPTAYYAPRRSIYSKYMVKEAVQLVKDQVSDWKQYDWDDDGEVDQVYVVYAGFGQADTGNPNHIWPHAGHLSDYDLTLEVAPGLVVDSYACGQELQYEYINSDYGIGMMCHEYSHCLGHPDYYATDYSGGQGMYDWDLMDSGNYNGMTFVPANYTCFERWMNGWVTPIELGDEDVTVENLKTVQNGGECYVIYNKAHPLEFFLIENRQLEGFDAMIYSAGLHIIHVDYDAKVWASNKVNNDINHQRLTLVPADGRYLWINDTDDDANRYYPRKDFITDPFPQDGVTAFNKWFKTTEPQAEMAAHLYNKNEDGTYDINWALEDITQHDDGTISFRFIAHDDSPDPNGIKAVNRENTASAGTYDLSGRQIVNHHTASSDGEVQGPLPRGIYIRNGKKVVVK